MRMDDMSPELRTLADEGTAVLVWVFLVERAEPEETALRLFWRERAAVAALEALGLEASCVSTGGGSDASALVAAGLPVLNVANGTERNHQPDESVSVETLETMLDLTLAIVERSAAV